MAYLVILYLTPYLTFHPDVLSNNTWHLIVCILTYHLTYSDILLYLFSSSFQYSDIHSYIYSDILPDIYSDILSGICSIFFPGIWSGLLSDMLSNMYSGFYLTYILTFYLAFRGLAGSLVWVRKAQRAGKLALFVRGRWVSGCLCVRGTFCWNLESRVPHLAG